MPWARRTDATVTGGVPNALHHAAPSYTGMNCNRLPVPRTLLAGVVIVTAACRPGASGTAPRTSRSSRSDCGCRCWYSASARPPDPVQFSLIKESTQNQQNDIHNEQGDEKKQSLHEPVLTPKNRASNQWNQRYPDNLIRSTKKTHLTSSCLSIFSSISLSTTEDNKS